jgi:hypothetical protein
MKTNLLMMAVAAGVFGLSGAASAEIAWGERGRRREFLPRLTQSGDDKRRSFR